MQLVLIFIYENRHLNFGVFSLLLANDYTFFSSLVLSRVFKGWQLYQPCKSEFWKLSPITKL